MQTSIIFQIPFAFLFILLNYHVGSSNLLTPSFLGFSVYVSNTTKRLEGTLCFKDNNFTLDTIPAVVTTICPVHGQYVIYYNERLSSRTYPNEYSPYAENNLCEVEVFGESFFTNYLNPVFLYQNRSYSLRHLLIFALTFKTKATDKRLSLPN